MEIIIGVIIIVLIIVVLLTALQLFIYLLPIMIIVIGVLYAISYFRMMKARKNSGEYNEKGGYYQKNRTSTDGVIDVEYTEKEVSEDEQ